MVSYPVSYIVTQEIKLRIGQSITSLLVFSYQVKSII